MPTEREIAEVLRHHARRLERLERAIERMGYEAYLGWGEPLKEGWRRGRGSEGYGVIGLLALVVVFLVIGFRFVIAFWQPILVALGLSAGVGLVAAAFAAAADLEDKDVGLTFVVASVASGVLMALAFANSGDIYGDWMWEEVYVGGYAWECLYEAALLVFLAVLFVGGLALVVKWLRGR